MNRPLRIATRSSALAIRQTELALDALRRRHPGLTIDVVPIRAEGDDDARPVWRTDAPGIFTNTLTRALISGDVDAAVHSLKDLPVRVGPLTTLAAILERGDAGDVLIAREHRRFDRLPPGAVVGTSSLRRRAQVLARRPDIRVVEIRGNVLHRLDQVASSQHGLDAIVLAQAGVRRLDRESVVTEALPADDWLPAPGQGAIAVEVRADDLRAREVMRVLDHHETRLAVTAERAVLSSLGAGCHAPVGAFARRRRGGDWLLSAGAWAIDGRRHAGVEVRAALSSERDADECGRSIAALLLEQGAAELVSAGETSRVAQ